MPLSRIFSYPPGAVCSEIVMPKGNLICPDCMEKLAFVRCPVCKCCGKEIVNPEAEYCFDCTRHPHSFDSGMALINYNDTASRSMALIKYHGCREYLDFYSEAMFRRFGPAICRLSPDCIIPVPVHKSRLKKRGFNQAQELGIRLSAKTGIPMRTEFLKRTKKTLPKRNWMREHASKIWNRPLYAAGSRPEYAPYFWWMISTPPEAPWKPAPEP